MIAFFSFIYIILNIVFLGFTVLLNVKLTLKQYRMINILLLISIGLLSYNYIPTPDQDLSKYYDILDYYKILTWKYAFEQAPYSQTPITNAYFYWMSRLDNYSLFAMIPTVVNFGLVYFVADKLTRKYNLPFQAFALYIIGIVSVAGLLGTISGIRQNLAWSFLMLAVYYDYFGERIIYKPFKILLYLIPFLIHTSTMPILILRIYLVLIGKIRFLKYSIVLWPFTLIFINQFNTYLPSVFQSTLNRFWYYTDTGVIEGFRFLSSLVGFLILGLMLIAIRKLNLNTDNKFYNFFLLVFIFGVTSVTLPTLFGRIFTFLMYISLPIIGIVFKSSFKFRSILIYTYTIFLILVFIYKDILPGHFLEEMLHY